MPAVQTSYNERIAKGYPGMVVNETNHDGDTRICETEAGIGFGLAVSQGTADKGAVLGGAVTGFAGVSVRDVALAASDEDKYQEGANMGVHTRGDIWVTVGEDVVAGDPVHYNSTTGVFLKAGGVGPVKGAQYMTSAANGELAVLRLTGALGDN